MQLTPTNILAESHNRKIPFGHEHCSNKSSYSVAQKAVITTTTAIGIATSLALLSKSAGYSLKPSKMFKNIKNSFLANVDFEAKEVISIGAGSCLGGLIGGYLIDKNPQNRQSKKREAIMQMGNISIPIISVTAFSKLGSKLNKTAEGIAAILGLLAGVHFANFVMNKVSNAIFNNKTEERGVKATDFSAHVDDMLVAANCISKNKYVHRLARIVPAALIIPGFEVGTKEKD